MKNNKTRIYAIETNVFHQIRLVSYIITITDNFQITKIKKVPFSKWYFNRKKFAKNINYMTVGAVYKL